MDAVCEELDQVLLQYMDELQALLQARQQLDLLVKDGLFLMAKARYTMGAKSIGRIQYDEKNMSAAVKVVVQMDNEPFSVSDDVDEDNEDHSGKDGLKKRVGKNKGDELDASAVKEEGSKEDWDFVEDLTTKRSTKVRAKDPLMWFGVLVPGALRQCQQRFKQAALITVELTSQQARVTDLKVKYDQLMRQKNKMTSIHEKESETTT